MRYAETACPNGGSARVFGGLLLVVAVRAHGVPEHVLPAEGHRGESVSRLFHTPTGVAMIPLASLDDETFGVSPLTYARNLAGERLSIIC